MFLSKWYEKIHYLIMDPQFRKDFWEVYEIPLEMNEA